MAKEVLVNVSEDEVLTFEEGGTIHISNVSGTITSITTDYCSRLVSVHYNEPDGRGNTIKRIVSFCGFPFSVYEDAK